MVEPDEAGEVFEEGASVILVRQAGARYFAIRNELASLRDVSVPNISEPGEPRWANSPH